MRRPVSMVVSLVFTLSLLFAVSPAFADEPVTLRLFCQESTFGNAISELAEDYKRETGVNLTVEVTNVSGVEEYLAALSSKLVAGDVPDFMQFQWSTQIQKYAKAGYLMDLTDLNIEELINPIFKPLNEYKGQRYAYPVMRNIWGMFWNENLAAKYGVTTVPQTMDQLIEAFETIRANGLEYPYLVAGKDGSGATAYVFAYLHQQVSGLNPDFYYQILMGEKGWNSPEIAEMLTQYDRALQFSPPDTLGMDIEEIQRRFAREEAVCYINGSAHVGNLREMNPDFDFILAPAPCLLDEANACCISDYDCSFAISATTKEPEIARDFYKYCYSAHGGEVLARNMTSITVVKEANPDYDSAILVNFPFIEAGKAMASSEREWIPGIKEIMKANVQDWMSGAISMEQAMENWNNEHLRLLEASPEFIEEYIEMRENTK